MLLQVTPASVPSSPACPCPPIPHLARRSHFAQPELLARKDPPLSRFHLSPIPRQRAKASMPRNSSVPESFPPSPSRHIPSWCRRHRNPERNSWKEHT